jgi:hypothetical protein
MTSASAATPIEMYTKASVPAAAPATSRTIATATTETIAPKRITFGLR